MSLKLPTSILFAAHLLACGPAADGPASGDVSTARSSLRATLSGSGGTLRTPRGGTLREAIVSIDWVKAHGPDGWVTLREGPALQVDILRLADSAADLGFANLVGKVNQIRLHVDGAAPPYVTTDSGERVAMKVPSGEQSGIKVKGLWDIGACQNVGALLELDGKKSIQIHATGHGDLYIMRPVIKAGRVEGGAVEDCQPGEEPIPGEPTDPDQGGMDPGTGGIDPGTGGTGTGDGTPGTGDGTPGTPGTGDGTPGTGDGTPLGDTTPTDGLPTGGTPNGECALQSDCSVGAICVSGGCVSF